MTHAHEVALDAIPASPGDVDRAALRDLDEALRGLRRLTMKPPEVSLTLPGSSRRIDFAKLLACTAIGGLTDERTDDDPPVTVKAVATALDLEHSTVSRVLSDAEADGLVTRTRHLHDKRSTVVALTTLGETVVEGFESARLHFIGAMMQDWSRADVTLLASLMSRFVDTANAQKQCWSDLSPEELVANTLQNRPSS